MKIWNLTFNMTNPKDLAFWQNGKNVKFIGACNRDWLFSAFKGFFFYQFSLFVFGYWNSFFPWHTCLNRSFQWGFIYYFWTCFFLFCVHLHRVCSCVVPLKFRYQKMKFSYVKNTGDLTGQFFVRFESLLDLNAIKSVFSTFLASFWISTLSMLLGSQPNVIVFGFWLQFMKAFLKKSFIVFFTFYAAIFLLLCFVGFVIPCSYPSYFK